MSRELIRSWTKKDFQVDWFSGSGAGGQHRNKHQNCVRLRHVETGITTVGQGSRSRKTNLREALEQMATRLRDHYYPATPKDRAPATEHVRTYNQATNLVTDHASGLKHTWDDFNFNEMIIARKTVFEDSA